MRALVLAALLSGCVADYAVRSRHSEPRMPTPAWRLYVDMAAMAVGGAIAVKAPDGVHWIGFGGGLAVWAVDMIAVMATGATD